jgi:hypothetical protein
MAWLKGEIDYAGERLDQTVERGMGRLDGVVREGIGQVGQELRQVVESAGEELRQVVENSGQEMDTRLERISQELHDQRRFTREDIRELVDYAAERLGVTLDGRIQVMRQEISALAEEKVEYLKSEVDRFFIQRQEDLARERRRLLINIVLAASASIAVGLVSLAYQRLMAGSLDLFGLFRVLFAALAGGWGTYLAIHLLRRYLQMTEHRRDALFLAMRYFGFLRPRSLFLHVALLLILALALALLFFPVPLAQWSGNARLMDWASHLAHSETPGSHSR